MVLEDEVRGKRVFDTDLLTPPRFSELAFARRFQSCQEIGVKEITGNAQENGAIAGERAQFVPGSAPG